MKEFPQLLYYKSLISRQNVEIFKMVSSREVLDEDKERGANYAH